MSYVSFVMQALQLRREERSHLVQAAKLRLPGAAQAWSCMIREISPGGARLRLPRGFEPDGRVLITALAIGTDRPAQVAWRNETSIGIAFE